MKKLALVLLTLSMSMPMVAYARSGMMMSIARGGLGFLFPDFNNSFIDPAEFSRGRGFAVEALAGKTDTTAQQEGEVSVAYGSGRFGIGAYDSRLGTSINTSGQYTETAGAAMGVSMAQNRLALGVGYGRDISAYAVNPGTINASLTYKAGDRGFAIGFGGSTTLPPAGIAATNTGTVSLGYAFQRNNSFEVFATDNDFSNSINQTAGVALTLGSQFVYFGGLAQYNRLAGNYETRADLGFVLAQAVDFSFFGDKVLATGAPTLYGATLRLVL